MSKQDLENENTVFDLDVRDARLDVPSDKDDALDASEATETTRPDASALSGDEALLADLDLFSEDDLSSPHSALNQSASSKSTQASDAVLTQHAVEDPDLFDPLLDEPLETPSAPKAATKTTSKKTTEPLREPLNQTLVNAMGSVALDVAAVIGRKRVSVDDLARFRAGMVIEVGATHDRLVELVANGKTLGQGELVMVDGRLGVRLIKCF